MKSMVGVRSSSARQWSSLVGERSSWVRSARVRRWWSAGPGDRVRSWVAWWARRFRRRLGGRIVEDRQQRVRRGHVDDVDRRRRFSGLCEEDAEAGDQRDGAHRHRRAHRLHAVGVDERGSHPVRVGATGRAGWTGAGEGSADFVLVHRGISDSRRRLRASMPRWTWVRTDPTDMSRISAISDSVRSS